MPKKVLAFDFGASSGRAMLGSFQNGKIEFREIHRFENNPVTLNGTLYWDFPYLFQQIKVGITQAKQEGGFDSIAIDTWGVDFGLIDRHGDLLQNPVHYRDLRTDRMMEEVFAVVPREEVYRQTGIQFMRINSLYQLMYLAKERPELLKRTEKILFMPDLFSYFLTGKISAEYTMASTTQLMNPNTGDWCYEMLEKLGIPTRILPELHDAGTIYGELSDAICEELDVPKVPVISVAAHDTASAVAAIPTKEKDFIYISCGTWSLFGTELEKPCINEKTLHYNLTNEGGINRTTRLLKNTMGLWLIQESRRQWRREGFDVSYHDLEVAALAAEPFRSFIDPNAPEFEMPGNLPNRVREFCKRTGQPVPENRGEVMRCIYESLALKHRSSLEMVEDITDRNYETIHVIGGGVKDGFLCQITANACNKKVVAGPMEATVTGNIAVQLMTLGEFENLSQVRQAVAASSNTKTYLPADCKKWDAVYERFLQYQA